MIRELDETKEKQLREAFAKAKKDNKLAYNISLFAAIVAIFALSGFAFLLGYLNIIKVF